MAGVTANSSSKTMTSGATAADQAVTGYVRNERITLGVTPAASSSYLWTLGLPAGSSANKARLTASDVAAPAFVPDLGGTYVVTCQVDGATTYVLRLTALDVAVSESVEAIRMLPRTDAQVTAPSAGVVLYYSSTQGGLAFKTSTGVVRTVDFT
jgi:hypothetical protein